MRRFADLSLKHKLTLLSVLTTTAALLLTCASLLVYDLVSFKERVVSEHVNVAEVIGYNSVAALTFRDADSAEQTLQALSADPHVRAACIYDRDGRVFAVYPRGHDPADFAPPPAGATARFGADRLDIYRPISVSGENLGTIYLRMDLADLREQLVRYALIIGAVMIVAILVAYLIASRVQRVISAPISDLVAVASRVAVEKDYAIRAGRRGNDELGRLIDGFNGMLAQIQARDTALQSARDQLEERVATRTRELQQEIVVRRRAEAELADSLSVLHATLESTIDGILVVDLKGKVTTFNRTFTEMWRIPRETLNARDDEKALGEAAGQLRDPEEFMHKVRELYAQVEAESFDLLNFKDGRVFERYSQPQRVGATIVGRVWCFRDITERKQAEAAIEKSHQELVDVSRQAGMAEVATSVLHNVGNVLNSVNVSAALVADHVRHTQAANVAKVAALFDQHKADLTGFLANDARGRMIPGYLDTLAKALTTEHTTILGELDHLRKNIEHIKDIVGMQQAYARTSGVVEEVSVPELIDDALRINAGSLNRRDVVLRRDDQARPVITTDKHKVMQILINLVRNATHACDESGRTDKLIIVRTTSDDRGVRIAVIDNGVGVPAENLARIFGHGFTTRKTGHGFGLHSGALAARELGGSLTVQSAGPGQGATFILELPHKLETPDHECPAC